MRAQTQPSPDDIDIASLWSVLKKNSTRILGVSALMGMGTLGVLSLVPSKYTSESQLQIGSHGINDPFRDPKVGSQPTVESVAVKVDKEAIASQVVALKSRDLANKLADEMKLAEREEFNTALGGNSMIGRLGRLAGLTGPNPGESEEERVYNAYLKALRVFQVRDTRVITIEFTSQDNELAAKAANRLAEIYQTTLRTQGVTQTEDASQWLRPQIDKLAQEVAEAESEVERFRSQTNQFRGGGPTSAGLNEQQLTDLTADVSKARAARSEAEARARSARELMQRGLADAIPEVQKSPVIQGLISLRTRAEREKAEADTTLLSGHLRMKQLNANVTDLRRQVNKEAQLIVDGLEKEAKAVALREELATKTLDEMKSRVGSKSGDIARLASLEGQAKAKRRELETLQASYEAARSRGDIKSVPIEAQIISRAQISSVPSTPKRMQHSLLAAAAGLILGFAMVILKELFSSARRNGPAHSMPTSGSFTAQSAAPAAQAARGAAPSAASRSAPQPAPVIEPAFAAPAAPPAGVRQTVDKASVDAIVNRLVANADGQSGYRTVITGHAAGIQVHEQALDIASALTAAGKQSVLIDWSLDGAGLSRTVGVEPSPGLTDLIGGRASFEDVIKRLPDSDAHFVPCGSPAKGEGSDADRINLVLDALDEAYDHIIVCGDHAVIRDLFLAIQGRFDAGVVVSDDGRAAAESGEGLFLGVQVTDIDVIVLERTEATRRQKMRLSRGSEPAEARV